MYATLEEYARHIASCPPVPNKPTVYSEEGRAYVDRVQAADRMRYHR